MNNSKVAKINKKKKFGAVQCTTLRSIYSLNLPFFLFLTSLGKHYDVHSKKSSPCGYCQKIIRKEKMKSHFFAEHPYQKYVCQICNKVCSFQSQLKQHTEGKNFE